MQPGRGRPGRDRETCQPWGPEVAPVPNSLGCKGAPRHARSEVLAARVDLAAGASQPVTVAIDPRLLADWKNGAWSIAGGDYGFALGENADALGPVVTVRMKPRRW